MLVSPLLELVAREHPALVHIPIGLVAVLPLAMLASFWPSTRQRWVSTAFFLALVGWLASSAAILSGLLWGHLLGLIPEGALLPRVTSSKQVLQHILQVHELAALTGFLVGSICVWLLYRVWKREHQAPTSTLRATERRFWERGVGLPSVLVALIWLVAWGFCGKLGGIMVFGNEETNQAAAAADKARRADAEAELPIRALDYASLEPIESQPIRSPAHGNRWRRIWVTASGSDAYKAGRPLPPGAYAVMSTFEDEKGKPSHDPGPIYMKEMKADGTTAFAFYWPRVLEALQKEVGGQDSIYWRGSDPGLIACLGCHDKGKPVGQ